LERGVVKVGGRRRDLERTIDGLVMRDRYSKMDRSIGASGAVSLHATAAPLVSQTGLTPKATRIYINQRVKAPLDDRTTVEYGGWVVNNYGLSVGSVSLGGDRKLSDNTVVHVDAETSTDGVNKVNFETTRNVDKRTGVKVGFGGDFVGGGVGCNLQSWRR